MTTNVASKAVDALAFAPELLPVLKKHGWNPSTLAFSRKVRAAIWRHCRGRPPTSTDLLRPLHRWQWGRVEAGHLRATLLGMPMADATCLLDNAVVLVRRC